MKKETTHSAIRSFHEYLEKDQILEQSPLEPKSEAPLEDDSAFITFAEALKESRTVESTDTEALKPVNEEIIAAPTKKPAEPLIEESHAQVNAYRIVRDRDENFECNLSVEGTSLAEAQVRLVLDGDPYNFMFYGKIYADGKCVIPIRKGLPLHEGASGKIRLEVIAEDQLFVGWQDQFVVEASKKLKVELKEQKSVKVNFVNK